MIYLDTHVVVWLYAGKTDLLSPLAVERIEAEDLLISPMVQLELEYLREIDRLTVGSALIIESLAQRIGLTLCDLSFATVVVESIAQSWTRDPFDRLITAQAIARNALLLTKDRHIQDHCALAVW
jgi:PIN domain nuclease of toxin-antitoxin system